MNTINLLYNYVTDPMKFKGNIKDLSKIADYNMDFILKSTNDIELWKYYIIYEPTSLTKLKYMQLLSIYDSKNMLNLLYRSKEYYQARLESRLDEAIKIINFKKEDIINDYITLSASMDAVDAYVRVCVNYDICDYPMITPYFDLDYYADLCIKYLNVTKNKRYLFLLIYIIETKTPNLLLFDKINDKEYLKHIYIILYINKPDIRLLDKIRSLIEM